MHYVPQSLKRTYPPQLPGSPTTINLDVLYYSEQSSQLKVCWSSPNKWNGAPLAYSLFCTMREPNNLSLSEPEQVYDLTVNWRQLCQDIWVKGHLGLLVDCRVRSINSNGASVWSHHAMQPIEYRSIFIYTVDFEFFDTRANQWNYGSIATRGKLGLFPRNNKKLTTDLPGIICSHHNKSFLLEARANINQVGCCDWISQKYYTAINKSVDESIWIASVDIKDNKLVVNEDLYQHLVQIDQVPYQMLCYPLLSTLIWSHEHSDGNITFQRLSLNEVSVNSIRIPDRCTQLQNATIRSPAITFTHVTDLWLDNGKLTTDDTFIVQTSAGLWSVSFDDTKCKPLSLGMNRQKIKHMNQIYFRTIWEENGNSTALSNIASVLIIVFDKTNSSQYFKYTKVRNSRRNFTHWSNVSTINYYREISLKELQFIPTYPALVSIQNTNPIKRFWSRREFQFPLPITCIYPNATLVSWNTESEHITRFRILVLWESSKECQRMSKPTLDCEVKYRPWTGEDNNKTTAFCFSAECACYNNPRCRVWKSDSPTSLSQFDIPLVNLESDTWFYIEVAVYPSLGNYPKLWYGSGIRHRSFRSAFLNHYKSPKLVLVVLYSTTPPLFLLLVVSALLAYLYRTRWYIYQHISRITRSQIIWNNNEKLGEGHFSEVFKAKLKLGTRTYCGLNLLNGSSCDEKIVAMKVLKEMATEGDKKSFLEEAILMSHLKNYNIIHPLGICLDSKPMMLALEFMDGGSLNKYLQRREIQDVLLPIDLWQICADVANACLYLEENCVIHRDLSAKNCLVRLKLSNRPEVVKIGDFGLAKDVHRYQNYQTSNTVFPRQHTAPEGFQGIFSSRSDSWSYGVVLWEVFSWGASPYQRCSLHVPGNLSCPIRKPLTSSEIETFVCNEMKTLNHWVEKPCSANFPNPVKNLMVACWAFNPALRLQFDQIRAQLDDIKIDILNMQLEKPSDISQTVEQDGNYSTTCTTSSSCSESEVRTNEWYH